MRSFIVYTTEEGGTYKIERATRAEYEAAVKQRCLRPLRADFTPLAMVGFLKCEEYHDFILDETIHP